MQILIDFNGARIELDPNLPDNTVVVVGPIAQPVIKI